VVVHFVWVDLQMRRTVDQVRWLHTFLVCVVALSGTLERETACLCGLSLISNCSRLNGWYSEHLCMDVTAQLDLEK